MLAVIAHMRQATTQNAAGQESNGRGNGRACEADQSPPDPVPAAPGTDRLREVEAATIERCMVNVAASTLLPGLEPVAWVVAVEENGEWKVYVPIYRSREAAESDAKLPMARGQRAQVLGCYRPEEITRLKGEWRVS